MRFFEICKGDDSGQIVSIKNQSGLDLFDSTDIDFDNWQGALFKASKKPLGDFLSTFIFYNVFSEKVILKCGDMLRKWGSLFEIIAHEDKNIKYYGYFARELLAFDLVKSKPLFSPVQPSRILGFFNFSYADGIKGDEIFQALPLNKRTLYSEDFVRALYETGAKGYYLNEWSDQEDSRKYIGADLLPITRTNQTMKRRAKPKTAL